MSVRDEMSALYDALKNTPWRDKKEDGEGGDVMVLRRTAEPN